MVFVRSPTPSSVMPSTFSAKTAPERGSVTSARAGCASSIAPQRKRPRRIALMITSSRRRRRRLRGTWPFDRPTHVSQRPQALALLGGEADRPRGACLLARSAPTVDRALADRLRDRRRGSRTARLPRIGGEIVPLLSAQLGAVRREREDGLPARLARAQEELSRAVVRVVRL